MTVYLGFGIAYASSGLILVCVGILHVHIYGFPLSQGIGHKVMEKQGWQEGTGLGRTVPGMADALDNEGQPPHDKTGLG